MKRISEKIRRIIHIFRDSWQHILAVFMFLLVIAAVYWRDLEILANEALHAEALSHVLLVPLFVSVLLYWKRDAFKALFALDSMQKKSGSMFFNEFVGLSLCLIAFLVYWYGSYTFYPLANFNTQASYTILKGLGVPVTLSTMYGSPTIMLAKIQEQQIPFTVDIPCSGIYMLTAFFMFAVFLLAIVQASILKKTFMIILGFAVFEVLNIIRITSIVSVAYVFGEEVAMLIFHSMAGLVLTFIGIFVTLIASERLLKVKVVAGKVETSLCSECNKLREKFHNFCLNCGRFFNSLKKRPSRIFWAKLALLLSICFLISLSVNAPVFAISKETITATSWDKTTEVLPQVPEYRLAFLYRDTEYERIAKQDASLVYAYFPTNLSNPVTYVLMSVASSISNLHNWEVCLISWQTAQGQYPLVEVLASKDTYLLEGNHLIARYLVFRNSEENYTQFTLYWYERATFKIGATVQQKYVRISLVILIWNALSYQQYENQLLELGEAVARYWEPIKSQSLFSLGIPAQQTLLVFSVAFIIVTKAAQSTREWRKRINNLKIFNNFASATDKLVLQTITEMSKANGTVTTAEIRSAIKNNVGKTITLERLMDKLNRLQEYGIIKLDITIKDNCPRLVWKSLVSI